MFFNVYRPIHGNNMNAVFEEITVSLNKANKYEKYNMKTFNSSGRF